MSQRLNHRNPGFHGPTPEAPNPTDLALALSALFEAGSRVGFKVTGGFSVRGGGGAPPQLVTGPCRASFVSSRLSGGNKGPTSALNI